MKIRLDQVTKSYQSDVIKDLSYTFESGKLYVIKGVSGSGKTTLLNMIGGIDTDFTGSITPDTDEPLSAIRSYVFQSSLLLSRVTILENLFLIKADYDEITRLCELFGITPLLDKYPEQISGGERQRVAIVRALLLSPKLFLADEPTASLDGTNSVQIAKTIAGLKDFGQIVIVATHEPYFDSYADEIIHLKDGKIDCVEKLDGTEALDRNIIASVSDVEGRCASQAPANGTSALSSVDDNARECLSLGKRRSHEPDERRRYNYLKFTLKRHPGLLNFPRLMPLALVFLLVLLVSTVQNSFKSEFMRHIQSDYPMDFFVLQPNQIEDYLFKDRVKIYDHYTAVENDVYAYYLLAEKDSVFCLPNMIETGGFPKTEREILVSESFLIHYFHDETSDNVDALIGRTVVYKGLKLVISGVTASFEEEASRKHLSADLYYRNDLFRRGETHDKVIFVPYETLEMIGKKEEVHDGWKMCVLDGLSEDESALEALQVVQGGPFPNQFYAEIQELQDTINAVSGIFAFVLLVVFSLSCIFLVSIIRTELFYRRKEIGFLQIFGLEQKRIKRLLSAEYRLKIFASLSIALLFYIAAVIVYRIVAGAFIIFHPIFTPIVIVVLLAIYLKAVYKSIRNFLKQSILSLIV